MPTLQCLLGYVLYPKLYVNVANLYEFVIGALENSEMEQNFIYGNHGLVLQDLSNFYKSINE